MKSKKEMMILRRLALKWQQMTDRISISHKNMGALL